VNDPSADRRFLALISRPCCALPTALPSSYAEASTGLSEELPKNGDVPKSPITSFGSLDAVGRHHSEKSPRVRIAGAGGAHVSAHPRTGGTQFGIFTQLKEDNMYRRTTLAMTATALLCLAAGSSAGDSLAQQKPLKGQLVGTWTLVSSDQVRADGTRLNQFGTNPKGITVFNADGRFFLMVASADDSKIASRDPDKRNSEGVGSLITESIAYYGVHRQRGGAGYRPSSRISRPAHSGTRSAPIKNELSPLS
jgi:hypothetical protein